jgi:hypothetical protein
MLVALFCPPASALGQVGVWDVSISGTVTGLGIIQLYGDGSLGGIVLVRPTRNIKVTNLPEPVEYGFTGITGSWGFDLKGRLIGFFQGGSVDLPLNMSFDGATKLGATISLTAIGNDGKWKIKGVPAVDDTTDNFDQTSWNAQVVKDFDKFTEFFTLTAVDLCIADPPPPDPNDCIDPADLLSGHLYVLEGTGPGYLTEGAVLFGAGGRIGVELQEDVSGLVRAVTGKYSLGKTSSMIGADDDHDNVKMSAFSPELLP